MRVREFILPALALCGGTHNEDDVLAGIYSGKFVLWVPDDQSAALVSEIITYPRLKVLNCFLGGGSLHGLQSLEKRITVFAHQMGCTKLRIIGRDGWLRVLGGEKIATLMQRTI
jgi:hypothetical protein